MRIILDTDKRTITVPWNYGAKLDELNRLIMSITDDPSKQKTFSGYIDECWREAIAHAEDRIVIAPKPVKRRGGDED